MIASHSSKRFRFVWTACIACVIVLLLGLYFYGPPIPAKVLPEFPWRTGVHGEAKHSSPSTGATVPVTTSPSHDQQETRDVIAVVVASRLSENTTWLDDALPDFEVVKYVTDDLDADLFVPVNKGHEAMVYLTYIVNNYHNLPSLVIFSHAQRYQWHNDDPLYDGARMLSRVQIPYLHQKGYTNLRCAWHWGCPAEIRPFEHGDDPAPTDPAAFILQDVKPYFYKHAFEAMFPGEPVPEVVGTGCCAQFAVSAERIRQRSIGDYQRVRRWIIRTELPDNVSGRIMEYIWHILFNEPAVSCPSARECYCNVYGKCKLDCPNDESCNGQWEEPPDEKVPAGWPEIGLDGKPQDVARLREMQERDYTRHG